LRNSVRVLCSQAPTARPHDDPDFAPLVANDFAGIPPAAIFATGIDPLCQDAENDAALLLARRIRVRYASLPVLSMAGCKHAARAAPQRRPSPTSRLL
jgi:acetyl esterase/lipase